MDGPEIPDERPEAPAPRELDATSAELQAMRAAIDDLRRRPVSVDADQLRSVLVASLAEAAAPPPNLLVTAIRRLDRLDARLDAIEGLLGGRTDGGQRALPSASSSGGSAVAQPVVLPAADPEAIAEALARRLAATYQPAALQVRSGPSSGAMVADVVAAIRPLLDQAARDVLEEDGVAPPDDVLDAVRRVAESALERAAGVLAPLSDLAPPLPSGSPIRPEPVARPTVDGVDAQLVADAIASRVAEAAGRQGPAIDPAVLASTVATEVARRLSGQLPAAAPAPDRAVGALPMAALLEAVARVEGEVSRVTAAPDAVIGALSRLEAGVGALAHALEEDRDAQERTIRAGLEEASGLALHHVTTSAAALTALEQQVGSLRAAPSGEEQRLVAPDAGDDAVRALGPVVEETRSGVVAVLDLLRVMAAAAAPAVDEEEAGAVANPAPSATEIAAAVREAVEDSIAPALTRSLHESSAAVAGLGDAVTIQSDALLAALADLTAIAARAEPAAGIAAAESDEALGAVRSAVGDAGARLARLEAALTDLVRQVGDAAAASSTAPLEELRSLLPATLGAVLDERLEPALADTARTYEVEALGGRLAAIEVTLERQADVATRVDGVLSRTGAIEQAVLRLADEGGPLDDISNRLAAVELQAGRPPHAGAPHTDPDTLDTIAHHLTAIETVVRTHAARDDMLRPVLDRLSAIEASTGALAGQGGTGEMLANIAMALEAVNGSVEGLSESDGPLSGMLGRLDQLETEARHSRGALDSMSARFSSVDEAIRERTDPVPAISALARTLDSIVADVGDAVRHHNDALVDGEATEGARQGLAHIARSIDELGPRIDAVERAVRATAEDAAGREAAADADRRAGLAELSARLPAVLNADALGFAVADTVARAVRGMVEQAVERSVGAAVESALPTTPDVDGLAAAVAQLVTRSVTATVAGSLDEVVTSHLGAAVGDLAGRIAGLGAAVNERLSTVEHAVHQSDPVDLGPVVRLLEAMAIAIDLLPAPLDPSVVIQPLSAQLTALDDLVRTWPDPTGAVESAGARVAVVQATLAELAARPELSDAVAGVAERLEAVESTISRIAERPDVAEVVGPQLAALAAAVQDQVAGLNAGVGGVGVQQARAAEVLDTVARRVADLGATVSERADPAAAVSALASQLRELEVAVRELQAPDPASLVGPLLDRFARVEDALRDQPDPSPALAALADRVASVEEQVRESPAVLAAVADLRLAVRDGFAPTEQALADVVVRTEAVNSAVDGLVASVAAVRTRVDASAGVVDIGRRAADAAEATLAALSGLRSELVELGRGYARSSDHTTTRLSGLIEESVTQLTARIDNLAGIVERR